MPLLVEKCILAELVETATAPLISSSDTKFLLLCFLGRDVSQWPKSGPSKYTECVQVAQYAATILQRKLRYTLTASEAFQELGDVFDVIVYFLGEFNCHCIDQLRQRISHFRTKSLPFDFVPLCYMAYNEGRAQNHSCYVYEQGLWQLAQDGRVRLLRKSAKH